MYFDDTGKIGGMADYLAKIIQILCICVTCGWLYTLLFQQINFCVSVRIPIGHGSFLLKLHVRYHTSHLGTSIMCSFVATVILTDQILYHTFYL